MGANYLAWHAFQFVKREMIIGSQRIFGGYFHITRAFDQFIIYIFIRKSASLIVQNHINSTISQKLIKTFMETKEGSPQGGNISPLLANIYLNEFDQEYEKRGVNFVRYADDIVLLAKSDRAAKRLLESSTKYLEETLKLKVNQEKSRVVSVFAIRNFKYLGFTLGKNGKGIYIRVHVIYTGGEYESYLQIPYIPPKYVAGDYVVR